MGRDCEWRDRNRKKRKREQRKKRAEKLIKVIEVKDLNIEEVKKSSSGML